jgi:hypothetical protein
MVAIIEKISKICNGRLVCVMFFKSTGNNQGYAWEAR